MKKFRFLFSLFLVAGIGMLAWAVVPPHKLTLNLVTSPDELVEGKKYVFESSTKGSAGETRYFATKGHTYETWSPESVEEEFNYQWQLKANAMPSSTKPEFALMDENGQYVGTSISKDGVRIMMQDEPSYFLVEAVKGDDGNVAGFAFKNLDNGKYLARDRAYGWCSEYVESYGGATDNAVWILHVVMEDVVTPEPEPEPVVEYYPIAFDKDAPHVHHAGRKVTGANLTSAAYGAQTLDTDEERFYNEAIAWGEGFEVASGEQLSVGTEFPMNAWMHNYFYIDRGNDGQFNVEINAAEDFFSTEDDLIAFSLAGTENSGLSGDDYYTMAQEKVSNTNVVHTPAFNLPELADGFYRARFKLDWGCVLPGGSTGFVMENGEPKNVTRNIGGAIIDTRLHVHGANINVATVSEGGQITDAEGNALAETAPFGQALTFKVAADATHNLLSVKARYGYRFDGEAVQYGMEQWKEADLTADENGVYTLTEEMTSANVQITATYEELPPADYAPQARAATLEDGKIYMILNATRQNGERWGMLYNGENGIKLNQTAPSAFTTQDVAYLWQVEVVDAAAGLYNIKNVANALYVNGGGSINNENGVNLAVKELTTSDKNNPAEEALFMNEADNSVFTPKADITTADKLWTISEGGNCWNGNPADGTNPPKFGNWSDSHGFAFYEINNEEAALAALATAEAPYAVQRSAEYKALAQTVNAKSAEWLAKAQAENGVTDAAKYTTNAQATNEATETEPQKGYIQNLIDGDLSTYFHTTYGTPDINEAHYLQIDRGETTGDFYFYSYQRNNNNRPTKITIEGSTNGETWEPIKVIEGISMANPYYFSEILNGGEYTKIRFTVNETNTGNNHNGHVFFTYGEFYLFSAAEGAFAKQMREALIAFNNIQKMEDIAPAAALVAALDAPVAPAKFELVSSEPADGATIAAMPETLTLTFNDAIAGIDAAKAEEIATTAFEMNYYDTYFPSSSCSFSFEGNTLSVKLNEHSVLEGLEGTFRLTIPAGFVKNEAEAGNEEIVINITVAAPTLTEEQAALVATANDLLKKVGAGYPTVESEARASLSAAIAALQAAPADDTMAALEAAMSAYKASTTEIQMPENGKFYTITVVGVDGTKAYINYNGEVQEVVAYPEDGVLPESAIFTFEENGDGTYTLITEDGKFLTHRNQTKSPGVVAERGNTTAITFEKMVRGGQVSASSNEELFGFMTWKSIRTDNTKNEYANVVVLMAPTLRFDAASSPFYQIQSDGEHFTSALLIEEYQFAPTEVTITPDPMQGELDELPSAVTMEFSRDIKSVESVSVRNDMASREVIDLAADNWTIEGNKVTVTLPEELIQNKYELQLIIDVIDEKNMHVGYGRGEAGKITIQYYAKTPADALEVASIDPAEGTVEKLKTFTLKMKDIRQEGTIRISGFDESKVVALNNDKGEQVAKATLALHPDNLEWKGNFDIVIATLDTEITAVGTYTLVIPEATIYDAMYDPSAEDFGVRWGAVYNKAASFTFKVENTIGIESIETQNAVKSIYNLHGQKINKDVKNLTPGVYVINGKKVVVK